MRLIVISRSAEKDLLDIYRYSIKQWGKAQAKQYQHALSDNLTKIAQSPSLFGKSRDGLPAGYYLHQALHHLIVFGFDDHSVKIARVLHERMDVKSHRLD